ncbi:MAG: hypothetical protein HYS98_07310 [Deltaproteobacteria bacterium]|nr:hypothetical protein [Deltaproteobacteria bacterium]
MFQNLQTSISYLQKSPDQRKDTISNAMAQLCGIHNSLIIFFRINNLGEFLEDEEDKAIKALQEERVSSELLNAASVLRMDDPVQHLHIQIGFGRKERRRG